MFGDIDTAAKPYTFDAAHVLKQLDQTGAASGSSDQSVMQPDGEKLRRALRAFAMEEIEGIPHIGEEIIAGREAAILVKAVVVRLVGIWDDEVGLVLDAQPIGQFIRKRIAVVEKSSFRNDKSSRIGAGAPSHPSKRPRAGDVRQNFDRAPDMLAFEVLGH